MSTTERGTYQMLWDCPYCGTEKLLGLDHRHCPCCGSPQDPEWRYFPSDEDKVAVEDHRYHGADRVCPACSTPNSVQTEFCTNCGSPLTEAAEAKRREAQEAADASSFAADTAKAAQAEFKGADKPKPPPPPDKLAFVKKAALGCFFLVVFAGIGLGLMALFWKKDASMTAAGLTWERSIEVEAYKTVQKTDWDDQVPSDARNVRCREAQRDTKKVADGETCRTKRIDQGDGTYREVEECKTNYRSEPVYDDKCTYDVDRWVTDRTEQAKGKGTSPAPSWPTVRTRGQEREGKRTETYTVHFKATKGGDSWSCGMPQKRWERVKPGSKWSGKVGVMTNSLDCDTLKQK